MMDDCKLLSSVSDIVIIVKLRYCTIFHDIYYISWPKIYGNLITYSTNTMINVHFSKTTYCLSICFRVILTRTCQWTFRISCDSAICQWLIFIDYDLIYLFQTVVVSFIHHGCAFHLKLVHLSDFDILCLNGKLLKDHAPSSNIVCLVWIVATNEKQALWGL